MQIVLRDPRQRVSRRTPILWAALALVQVVLLAAALVLATSGWGWFPMPWWAWVAYVVLALGYLIAMPTVRYAVHRWETTDTAVYTQSGWLATERRIAPMSRVQTVDFHQGVVAKLLGLADVTVTTASAAGPLHIHGLDVLVAEQLVADLIRRTDAEPGDAT